MGGWLRSPFSVFFFALVWALTWFPASLQAQGCWQRIQQLLPSPDRWEFAASLRDLPKTPLADARLNMGNEAIILYSKGQYFWGHLRPLPWQGGGNLYTLRDVRGQWHFFDDRHLEQALAWHPEDSKQGRAWTIKEAKTIHPRLSSQGHVDTKSLRARVCRHYSAFRSQPEGKKIIALLTKNPPAKFMGGGRFPLRSRYLAHCLGGGALAWNFGVWVYWLLYSRHRGSFAEQHITNFSLGLPAMLIMEQCLRAVAPRGGQKILGATLAANIAGNIYYELDFPGVWQPDVIDAALGGDSSQDFWQRLEAAQDSVTDPLDFTAGMGATALYAAFSRWLEKTVWIGKARLCSGG